ncbi:MAG: hypothetical protein E5Y67_00790 [Mesorhizobium sp.]|nr:MAG: hypothetical protein E5Y67_00790 [Mesorhizobium sp.]
MKISEYVEFDATGLASLVRAGDVTPAELACLAREAHDYFDRKTPDGDLRMSAIRGLPKLSDSTRDRHQRGECERLFKFC